jgi:hypothetical protein
MGLVASHGKAVSPSDVATTASLSSAMNPNLICEPGVGCGTVQYFENVTTVDNYTAYNRVEYISSRTEAEVVGCVVGDAFLGISFVLNPGETVSFVTGPVLWTAACDIGANIAGSI